MVRSRSAVQIRATAHMSQNSNTVLVTGAAGYIGSHAVKLLLSKGYRVIGLDNFYNGYHEAIEILSGFGDFDFREGDLRDMAFLEKLFSAEKIDAVMHFAALNLPDESVDKPIEYYDDNTLGTAKILEAMRKHSVKHMIYSSTSSVYGEVDDSPVKEDHTLNPVSPYGHSKVLSEGIINYYSRVHGMNSVIFRYFNVCGADDEGVIGDSKKPSQLLVQNCVRGALGLEPFQYTCSQVNTPDGTPIRDFIDVRDLADAHLAAMEYLLKGGTTQTMNLGTGSGYSVKEIVSKVEQILNVKIERGQGKARAGEYSASFADASKAKEVLGWTAKRSLGDSVTALVNWYKKHPKGYIR